MKPIHIAVIGHLTIDEVRLRDGRSYTSMGGTACYASIAAAKLGAKVKVISRVGKDFPEEYLEILERMGIDVSQVIRDNSSTSTRFTINYCGNERVMLMPSRAPDINLRGLALEADIIYLGSVAWEIDVSCIRELASRGFRIALDLQGVLRTKSDDNLIELKRKELDLEGLWLLKASAEEASILAGSINPGAMLNSLKQIGQEITMLTLGKRGALIDVKGKRIKVPCYEVREVDPTGAGDVFGSAFAMKFLETGYHVWAASLASAMVSILIEDVSWQPLLKEDMITRAIERAEIIRESISEA